MSNLNKNRVIETFQPDSVGSWSLKEPRVFNGMFLIRKYRITVEEIPEPNEVLAERLLYLWKNRGTLGISHSANVEAMQREAKAIGIELGY